MRTLLVALAFVLMPLRAAADVTIGLFAPTAPFDGSADRVSFVTELAAHLSGSGEKVIGKVYGRASAFAAAVKKGEIQFAVVDAPYAAALGLPYDMLGAATRGGAATAGWQLIAKGNVATIRALRGIRVAMPSIGAKAQAFLTNSLLGGEVDASYFGEIIEAADARSAVTMITIGKVDAAFVPLGLEIPTGTRRITTLSSVGWPMLVALPSADPKVAAAIAARAKTFPGAGGFGAFTAPGAGNYRALAGSFGKGTKLGPMALPPPARLSVKDLLEGRTVAAPVSDPLELVKPPPAP